MILPQFKYHEPENLEEACEILADLKGEASPLAGETDPLVNMKKGVVSPKHVLYWAKPCLEQKMIDAKPAKSVECGQRCSRCR